MNNPAKVADETANGFAPRRKIKDRFYFKNLQTDIIRIHKIDDLIAKHEQLHEQANFKRSHNLKALEEQFKDKDNQTIKSIVSVSSTKTEKDAIKPNLEIPIDTDIEIIKQISCNDQLINNNWIGLLQNMCMAQRWPIPTYATIDESGMPHERVFTMTCKIVNIQEIGKGKTKKIARHIAAHKMFLRLKETPLQLNEISQKMFFIDANYKLDIPVVQKQTDVSFDFVALIEEIAKKNKFLIRWVKIDDDEDEVEPYKKYMIQISPMPVGICVGKGETVEAARQNAARDALEFLKLLAQKII